ncbi:MAG: CotH kinase family protein [Bacteroidota bacterium]
MRLRVFVSAILLLTLPGRAAAQVAFESSNLPILVIDTEGIEIPDEPKIPARLGVIDNAEGARNHLADPFSGYDGAIAIEVRGATSQLFPKKAYGFETREADGSNNNVELLGLPRENDWVLHGPYSDKSLMRNAVAFALARATGRYASRARFCEVVLNGTYLGVYLLLEKIKRDDARVDIAKLNEDENEGDDLTGGYILKIDKHVGSDALSWPSAFNTASYSVRYQYDYPAPDAITSQQRAYIRGVIDGFEILMAGPDFDDPETGYAAVIDVGSFVDFFLVTELTRNVDGYRISTYLHKDKDSNGGRVRMGPVWDFNLAIGNANYDRGDDVTGYQVEMDDTAFSVPFWWRRLLESSAFTRAVVARWEELRRGPYHPDTLDALIDTQAALLDEAQARNFAQWPVLGEYVWPNPFVGQTYDDEVAYLRTFLRDRGAWLDANLPRLVVADEPAPAAPGAASLSVYPNPSAGQAQVSLRVSEAGPVRVRIVDALGRTVARLHDGEVAAGERKFGWEARRLPAGLYVVVVEGSGWLVRQKLVITGAR